MDFMVRVNNDISKKRGRGRPRKPDAKTTLVPVQLSKATVEHLDQWAKASAIDSRSGAARTLIERGLASESAAAANPRQSAKRESK
jgi:hypothetical protein